MRNQQFIAHELLEALLRPRSVAVLGASATRAASGNQVLANLSRANYGGDIHVVHPTAATVAGHRVVRTVGEIGADVDCALVSLPAPVVVDTLRELESIGCRAAVVPSIGLGVADRAAIGDLTARGGMAVHGPNSIGLLNVTDGIPLIFWDGWFGAERPGNVALISQSGSAATAVVKSTRSARFSKIIASGNEWGVTTADYLAWLAGDVATECVALILESISDVERFELAIRALSASGKPIVALHVGRSRRGAAATAAHTSALIGRADLYRALFEELSIAVALDYEEMASALDVLTHPSRPRAAGTRVAAVTESGGVAALVADLSEERGIELAVLAPQTTESLAALLPGCHAANPFDAGGSTAADEERMADAIRIMAADPVVDSVLVVIDGEASLAPSELPHVAADWSAVASAARTIGGKPLIAVSGGSGPIHPLLVDEVGQHAPIVAGIRNGLASAHAVGATAPRKGGPTEQSDDRWEQDDTADGELLEQMSHLRPGPVPHDLSAQLLARYGLPIVRSRIVTDAEAAEAFAETIGYPVAVKIASPDIAHRSDVGGVAVNLRDASSLRNAVDLIDRSVRAARPDASIEGFEVQEYVATRLEAMVGFTNDPIFGPVVSVGLGGVLVELIGDSAVARTPLDAESALRLIDRTLLASVAKGYRNLTRPTDLSGLANVVADYSQLASDFRSVLTSGDVNPVLVEEGTGRVRIVDALLITSGGASAP